MNSQLASRPAPQLGFPTWIGSIKGRAYSTESATLLGWVAESGPSRPLPGFVEFFIYRAPNGAFVGLWRLLHPVNLILVAPLAYHEANSFFVKLESLNANLVTLEQAFSELD